MSPIEGVPNVERVDIAPCVETLRAMVPHVRPEDQLREATRLFGIHQDEVELQGTPLPTPSLPLPTDPQKTQ